MRRPASFSTVFTLASAAAGALTGFLLFDLIPHAPHAMAAIWLCSCALDMGHTVWQGLQTVQTHEQNPVMRLVLRRTGSLRAASLAALSAEAALVLGGAFVVMHAWDPLVFCVLCGAAAGVHLSGYAESRRFLRGAPRTRA